MQRRTFLSLLAVPAVAALFPACGSDSKQAGPADPAGPAGKVGSVKGQAAHVTAGADPTAASAAINAFAADLFDRLVAADPTANLVFSPASIALALTMASAGAKGTTLQEMDSVLHITDPAAIHRSMNGLTSSLQALNQSKDLTAEGGTGKDEVQLSIANSLWGQADLPFEQAFLDLLSSEYDAGMELVDYKADAERARVAINAWVQQQTKDRIPTLLPPGVLTADSRLTLVNAIYLKANWADKFEKSLTTTETFHAPKGDVQVDMMHTERHFGYANGEGWQAVELPYVFDTLALTMAIGDSADVTLPTGDEVFAALDSRLVKLGMPKFDIETSTDLGSVLGALGMTTAFTDRADFSGMTTAEQLFISAVIHQANITVDEEGTEAAAATAVAMAGTSAPAPEETVELTIDRPFTFWLHDTSAQVIVFAGRVNDPSATRG